MPWDRAADEATRAMLSTLGTRIKSHGVFALKSPTTQVVHAFDPKASILTSAMNPTVLAAFHAAVGTEPVVDTRTIEEMTALVTGYAAMLDLQGSSGAELLRTFNAPLPPDTFRLVSLCGDALGIVFVPRTFVHPIAGNTGGAAIARAALPALVKLKDANAALVLDDSAAAKSLRVELGLNGPGAVNAVDRERLAHALEASDYYFTFEASSVGLEPPDEALAILVVTTYGTWTGYLLNERLYEVDNCPGETETADALLRQHMPEIEAAARERRKELN